MKLTLLELVQDQLSAIDSENVGAVGDTEEAGMCVNIANRAFEEIIVKWRWRHLKKYDQLDTVTALNEMTTKSGTLAFDPYNVWYNDKLVYFRDPADFLAMTIQRNTSESNIVISNNVKVYTDRDPQFFTSDNDETLIFDAYDTTGLAANLSLVHAVVAPTSRLSLGTAYFDLPIQAFPALSKKCVALAVRELKGDTQSALTLDREYKQMMASLGRNARLVDVRDDLRQWIIPRRTMRNTYNGTTKVI